MFPLGIPLAVIALAGSLEGSPNQPVGRGSWIAAPAEKVSAGGASSTSRILYLNRCVGGCSVTPGFEDSRTNHSSILGRSIQLSEWTHGEENWEQVVNCVRGLYAPFDIVVTDSDPGDQSHFEAMVAGTPLEGSFTRAGGVSPFTCSVIDNAITFTYAAIYDDMRKICNVVGQESAHAFGLDHELECADPLTYLPGCPIKSFQDVDAACGEFTERECTCGGETQNSVQYLYDIFGEGEVPEVRIERPVAQSEVAIGFAIEATGFDDHFVINKTELWIDGALIESQGPSTISRSAVFTAPKSLSPEPHEIEVRMYDDRNQYGSTSITVTQAVCQSTSECGFSYLCLAGQCVLGPGNSGGLGDLCQGSLDCDGQICATQEQEDSTCTAFCDTDPRWGTPQCPSGYECLATDEEHSVCMPERGGKSGGCSVGTSQSGAPLNGFLLFLLALCGTRYAHGRRRYSAQKSRSH